MGEALSGKPFSHLWNGLVSDGLSRPQNRPARREYRRNERAGGNGSRRKTRPRDSHQYERHFAADRLDEQDYRSVYACAGERLERRNAQIDPCSGGARRGRGEEERAGEGQGDTSVVITR